MGKQKRHPSWWQLWLLLPVLGILGFVEARATLDATGHRIVEVAIVLVVFGLVAVWFQANKAAMLREIGDHVEQAARRRPEALVMLPPDFAISADSNGNGHRRSAWFTPAGQSTSAAFYVDPEEEGQGD